MVGEVRHVRLTTSALELATRLERRLMLFGKNVKFQHGGALVAAHQPGGGPYGPSSISASIPVCATTTTVLIPRRLSRCRLQARVASARERLPRGIAQNLEDRRWLRDVAYVTRTAMRPWDRAAMLGELASIRPL